MDETPLERLLGALERVLRERRREDGFLRRAMRLGRRASWVLTLAYAAGLPLGLWLLGWVGERYWLSGLLLYLPPGAYLLPLLGLVPLALCFDLRQLIVHGLAALWLVFGYMDFTWSLWSRPEGAIVVATNNIGQNNRNSMQPFMEAEAPHLIALQDAWNRGPGYRRSYPEHEVQWVGEYLLMSRFPIRSAEAVAGLEKNMAARFVIEVGGREISVYNVHFHSPRRELANLRGPGFLAGLFRGRGIYSGADRARFQESLDQRIRWVRTLLQIIAKDPRPAIVVGDFNLSSKGYLYRLLARELSDAFPDEGRGFGYTFPGETRNPLSLFGPWMRLDYIFSHRGLKPTYCRTERGRPSQHRAVSAALAWRE